MGSERATWCLLRLGLGLLALVAVAACGPRLGPRPALPTAAAAVAAGGGTPTPVVKRFRADEASGPTPTPAPFATPRPRPAGPGAPKIPHDVARTDCLRCHGKSGGMGIPEDHYKRKDETCLGCHSVDYEGIAAKAAPVGHAVVGREDCLRCHLLAVGGATPMPGEHTGRKVSSCLSCHEPG